MTHIERTIKEAVEKGGYDFSIEDWKQGTVEEKPIEVAFLDPFSGKHSVRHGGGQPFHLRAILITMRMIWKTLVGKYTGTTSSTISPTEKTLSHFLKNLYEMHLQQNLLNSSLQQDSRIRLPRQILLQKAYGYSWQRV